LNRVWDEAHWRLTEADEVYIVGYGMRESDAKAREFILAAHRENQKTNLKVTIVLGEPGFGSARLEATLRQSLPRSDASTPGLLPSVRRLELETPPQYAQDFLQGWALGYVEKVSG